MFCFKILTNRGYMYPSVGRYLRLTSTTFVHRHVPSLISGNRLIYSQNRCLSFTTRLPFKDDEIKKNAMKETNRQRIDDNLDLICYGVDQNTKKEDLYRLFHNCTRVKLVNSKGYAVVGFNTEEEVDAWVKRKDQVVLGPNKLHLTYSIPKDDTKRRKRISVVGLRSDTTINDLYAAFPQAYRIYRQSIGSEAHVYFETEEEATEFLKGGMYIYISGKKCILKHAYEDLRNLPPGKTLTIRNLNPEATKEHLLKVFQKASSVYRHTGRTIGYVVFLSPNEKWKAFREHNGAVIMGLPCKCCNYLTEQEMKMQCLLVRVPRTQDEVEVKNNLEKIFPECVSMWTSNCFYCLEFAKKADCQKALRTKQYHDFNGKELVLKPYLLPEEAEVQKKEAILRTIFIDGLPEGTTLKRLSKMLPSAFVDTTLFERSATVTFPTRGDVDEFFQKEQIYRSMLGDQVQFRQKNNKSYCLIVSDLPDYITKEDLHYYFPSARDITQHDRLKYAHVTFARETGVNFLRELISLEINGIICPLFYQSGSFSSENTSDLLRLIVFNLPEDITEEYLRYYFPSATDITIPTDKKNFVSVYFSSRTECNVYSFRRKIVIDGCTYPLWFYRKRVKSVKRMRVS